LDSADPSQSPGFSISHSDGIALCAVGPEPLGIDVERLRPGVEWRPVVRQFFSQGERSMIERLGSHAFFAAWTLKEAIIKANGRTLADLPELDVVGALVSGRAECNGLRVQTLAVRAGYAAALAVPIKVTSVQLRIWTSRACARSTARPRSADGVSRSPAGA
jgi:4'-phosphopantetheinyl transferase